MRQFLWINTKLLFLSLMIHGIGFYVCNLFHSFSLIFCKQKFFAIWCLLSNKFLLHGHRQMCRIIYNIQNHFIHEKERKQYIKSARDRESCGDLNWASVEDQKQEEDRLCCLWHYNKINCWIVLYNKKDNSVVL